MKDRGVFKARLAEIVKKANGNIDLAVRKIAIDLFSEVIEMSPVDTGRFRANWQVSQGAPAFGVWPSASDLSKGGADAISYVVAQLQGMKATQSIFLVNNLPYSMPLEYGHSQQAPNGMVRVSIANFKSRYSGLK